MKEKLKNLFTMKNLIMAVVIILVLSSLFMGGKHFMSNKSNVKYEVLEQSEIPEKILEILPRYQMLERALACKVNGTIRSGNKEGEKKTSGYMVEIDKIKRVKDDDDKYKLIVYANFSDPMPGDTVTDAITYPYVVARTNLKALPYKIELKTRHSE